jgi:hypothetical protein
MTLYDNNKSIGAMITAYTSTFTPDFWEGKHPTLWPHPSPDSEAGLEYKARLSVLREALDVRMKELYQIIAMNENTRHEIHLLREQLLAATTLMESRQTREQGSHIRLLTIATIVFLPLTFVIVSLQTSFLHLRSRGNTLLKRSK